MADPAVSLRPAHCERGERKAPAVSPFTPIPLISDNGTTPNTEALPKPLKDPQSCDLIILNEGDTISCTILDITLDGYSYTTCPDGKVTHLIAKEKIKEIRYSDGRIQKILIPDPLPLEKKPINWWRTSLISLILSIGIIFIAAITMPPPLTAAWVAWTLGLGLVLSYLALIGFVFTAAFLIIAIVKYFIKSSKE